VSEEQLSKYAPKKLAEQEIVCPSCGKVTKVEMYSYEAPIEGTLLLIVINCRHCGYKYREATPMNIRENGVKIVIPVENEEALKVLLYRSPKAHVKIPELGVDIVPGPANLGEITTVEGLIMHIAENLFPLCDSMDDPAKCYDVVAKLTNIANGLEKATVIILDPSGLSTVIRSSIPITVTELSEEERKELEKSTGQIMEVRGRS